MKTSKRPIPVYIVDEHNEVFYYWCKAKSEGYLTEALDLFHVDAHDDMGRPTSFRDSIYYPDMSSTSQLAYYNTFAMNELHNGGFIVPAVLLGLVRNIYFIYPLWRRYKPKRKRYNVSSVFGEGKLLKYEMKAAENMDEIARKALPDTKHYNFSMSQIGGIPRKRKVILDIDLDYFACCDSITNNYRYELEITARQFRERETFLRERTLGFAGLDFNFLEKDEKFIVQIAYKKVKDAAHLPGKEEIISEINTLMNTLRHKKITPAVVTIARSCISGYCPNEYVEMIEAELDSKLTAFLR